MDRTWGNGKRISSIQTPSLASERGARHGGAISKKGKEDDFEKEGHGTNWALKTGPGPETVAGI